MDFFKAGSADGEDRLDFCWGKMALVLFRAEWLAQVKRTPRFHNGTSGNNYRSGYRTISGWWARDTPLKNMSSSIGMIRNPIYGKIKNVPNHQPDLYWVYDTAIIYISIIHRDRRQSFNWGYTTLYPLLHMKKAKCKYPLFPRSERIYKRWISSDEPVVYCCPFKNK